MTNKRIGFIGGGNMARSLIGGLLGAGYDASQIAVSEPDPQRREALVNAFAIGSFSDNQPVAEKADILVLAVKPQIMKNALDSIKDTIVDRKPLLISIAAGVRLESIEHWTAPDIPIVRVMPNTPALVASGASGLFANESVSEEQRNIAESIMRAVGVTVWLNEEAQLDTVTAVSGSGPAYFFYLMEAIQQTAIENGLDEKTANLLTVETALGAAKLALESNESPAELRRAVTSPGGTTQAALEVMEIESMHTTINKAVNAAEQRSRELADDLAKNNK
ncbi:MAG: pyrroline-5-carboxylate reductase [Gammaproteobacteria bacterium]|nr:pyrroline-5-carboxylate reductase [Gammaproteobacteria bacterium]